MSLSRKTLPIINFTLMIPIYAINCTDVVAYERVVSLEEVIVTAQKREQLLLQTPIAISTLNSTQLNTLGITSLDGLADSVIPSLRIIPNGISPSSLAVAIRGDGPHDVVQPTRQASVAIYMDGIYLGRAQGLNADLADLQRIEVLRGPQGTLYGRNSTSGAINLLSRKPTGEFGFKQSVTSGNFDYLKSAVNINFPKIGEFSAKIDYMHTEREGWVKNSLPGHADYNEFNKDGGRFSLNWEMESSELLYTYDNSDIQTAQVYFQLYEDTPGLIGDERNRETSTRFPLVLEPIDVDIEGHSLTGSWELSDNLTLKSLTGFRELDEDGFNDYGGTLYSGGIILNEDIKQEQFSQEIQLIGKTVDVEWVAGLYYFKEDSDYDIEFLFSLDANFDPIIPPVSSPFAPPTFVTTKAESSAIFGQGTWAVNDRMNLTAGARYTVDNKSAKKFGVPSPDIDSEHTDGSLTLDYTFFSNLYTYIKYSTAYKAGGYNARSATFLPFKKEVNKTWELGLKSEWLDRRLTLNAALFSNKIDDKQFDFIDPYNTFVLETLNAVKEVEISGLEIEFTALLIDDLIVGLNYTYLDADMPLQPHPTEVGAVQAFVIPQTPQHAGALSLDYTVAQLSLGALIAHIDVSSTDRFAFSPTPSSREDAYTLVNARVSVKNISLGEKQGTLALSLWGKNLMDEEYLTLGFNVGPPANTVVQAFGTPRTYGIDFTYEY
jgi:iron complex outermembrane recepter protein